MSYAQRFMTLGMIAAVCGGGLFVPDLQAADSVPGAGAQSGWQQVGWGGGAFYYSAAWHPTDANTVYLGGDCAGAYRSDDRAASWTFANNGIAGYGVFSLAVSPAAPDQVWAFTEDGLCKSTDRAKTWHPIPDAAANKLDLRATKNGSVRAVAVDPTNADVVYAGTYKGSLFKTVNGGVTWTELPYRDALPKAAATPAFTGAGSLRLVYDPAANSPDALGRVSRYFGAGAEAKDWTGFKTLSAQVRLAADAPPVKVALVVQTGDGWAWQQGEFAVAKPGAWTPVVLDISRIATIASVRMVHVVILPDNTAWKGEVLLDSMALQSDGAVPLVAGATPDSKTKMVADWEKIGDAEGWQINTSAADSRKLTSAMQSQEKRGDDVVSSVAVAGGAVFVSSTKLGLFRSEDGGARWSVMEVPKQVSCVTVAPHAPRDVWAACGAEGIRHSTDRGATWTTITPDPKVKPDVREIAVHPAKPGRVYAIANQEWGGTLFISDDHGATWTSSRTVLADPMGNPTNPLDKAEGSDVAHTANLSISTSIAVNPHDADNLVISANWRNVTSTDGGKTLHETAKGCDNTCVTDLQFHNGKTYVTAMDEGLLVSPDHGASWKQMYPLKYDADVSGHFWRVRVTGAAGKESIVTTASPWKSYGDPTCVNRVYLSADDGATFTKSVAGLPTYIPNTDCMWGRSFPRALTQDPTNPKNLYLGMDGAADDAAGRTGGGVFHSTDGGSTWTQCAGQPGSRRMFYGLAIDPTNAKRVFWSAGGADAGVFRSEDEGATWAKVFAPDGWSFNLEVMPSGTALVAGNNLFRSSDHGATWTPITTFADDHAIVGIAFDPADEKRIWVARTSWDSAATGGIFRTTDGGATWQDITGDIPYRKPQILRYDAANHRLWAAGVGLFTLSQ